MKKYRFLSLILCLSIFIGILSINAAAAGLENFRQTKTYNDRFADVSKTAWYYENVKGVYELGLMEGNSKSTFKPDGYINLAEAVTVAARIHSISPWGFLCYWDIQNAPKNCYIVAVFGCIICFYFTV